jgi:ABC-type dipeptide/oligopeptide/nickel transport system ATPase subunit
MRWSMDETFIGQIFQYSPSKNSRSSNKKIAKKMTSFNQDPQSALRPLWSVNCSTSQFR